MIIVLKRHNGTPNTAPFFHAKKFTRLTCTAATSCSTKITFELRVAKEEVHARRLSCVITCYAATASANAPVLRQEPGNKMRRVLDYKKIRRLCCQHQFPFVNRTTPTYLSTCSALPLLPPSWPSPLPSPQPPPPTTPLPPTTPPLPTTPPSTRKNPNPTLSNTELPMTTLAPTSTPKKPPTARLSPDLTKLLFPMVVSKPSPTPLTTTTVTSLMSNTKVPPSTPSTNPSPLTTPPPNPPTTLKKLNSD